MLSLLLLQACGVTEDSFPQQFAHANCEIELSVTAAYLEDPDATCDPGAPGPSAADLQACVDDALSTWDSGCDHEGDQTSDACAVATGTCTDFDAAAARDCIADMRATTCDNFDWDAYRMGEYAPCAGVCGG
jgi:hypothetical protein